MPCFDSCIVAATFFAGEGSTTRRGLQSASLCRLSVKLSASLRIVARQDKDKCKTSRIRRYFSSSFARLLFEDKVFV